MVSFAVRIGVGLTRIEVRSAIVALVAHSVGVQVFPGVVDQPVAIVIHLIADLGGPGVDVGIVVVAVVLADTV